MDYMNLSEGSQPFEGLIPTLIKNMGDDYSIGKRDGASDYIETLDDVEVMEYIQTLTTPEYDGQFISIDSVIAEKATGPEPGPDAREVVPIVPMAYIYITILTCVKDHPFYNERLAYKLSQSMAFSQSENGVLIYPNELLNFRIRNIYDFFTSIDEDGVAHKNEIYNNPFYTEEAISSPEVLHWMTQFASWNNLSVSDMGLVTRYFSAETVLIAMSNLFNIPLQSSDEFGNLMFDFNDGNMSFYTDIDTCVSGLSLYYESYIRGYYYGISQQAPIRAIFILETDYSTVPSLTRANLPKLTIGFITDDYTIFGMVPEETKRAE